jgi:hypothetical protein
MDASAGPTHLPIVLPSQHIHGFKKKKRERHFSHLAPTVVGASTASPALRSLSPRLGPLAAASKPADRPALLPFHCSPMEREIATARPPLPPPPQGSDAWSVTRKTFAFDTLWPNVHLSLTAIAASTLGEGVVAGRAQARRRRSWPRHHPRSSAG